MSIHCKPNMGLVDRLVRSIIGLALIYLGFFAPQIIDNMLINLILGLFGLVNVVAALFAYCPVYKLANFSTYKKNN